MSGPDPLRIVIVCAGVSGSGVAAGLVRAGAANGFSARVELVDPRPSLDAAGRPVPGLFVVGPPTRGSLGEVVGASEIVPHALTVAEALTDKRWREQEAVKSD